MVGIYKGHNSIITVDGVIVLNLDTLSDDALYLFQLNISQGFRVVERMRFVY